MISILDAIADKNLFGRFFKQPKTWAPWFAILAAIFALPMTAEQLAIYRQVTGRTDPPTSAAKEVWLCIGRRGGKSRIISLIAVWLACFFDYRPYLAPGEKGTVQIIAADKRQARTVLRYIKAFLQFTPMLARMIESENAESISLTNNIVIEVLPASYRATRGYTVVATLLDEIAFFRTDEDSASPDSEIVAAIRPSMITIPNAMLLAASSPYARRGTLFDAHKKYFGKDGPILVVQADTATVNPLVNQQIIADAYEQDATSASAEYGAHFRNDLESFVSLDVVQACVAKGIFERPPRSGVKYFGFADPSGGSSDSFTLAIAHKDSDSMILDAVRETLPPFSPEAVCAHYAHLLATYGINSIIGDKYASLWPVEAFGKVGIKFVQAARPKSDLYGTLLPLLNSRRVTLLDNRRLIAQLAGLDRRTARGGRDSIDHAPNAHDDLANAVAGVFASNFATQPKLRMFTLEGATGPRQVELDPRTAKPLRAREQSRVKWVTIPEAAYQPMKPPE